MKYAPYAEIIDIKTERKEYSLLCQGKSKIYKYYSDWEEHIKGCLRGFEEPQDLYNFKRYCINSARVMEKAPDMYLGYIALIITMYIDKALVNLPIHFMIVLLLGVIIYSIVQNKRLAKECHFFQDIIEIIEKQESASEQKNK